MKPLIIIAAFLFQYAAAQATPACHLEQPKAEIVLTIDGSVRQCNSGLEARFDMPMLESLPRHVVKTENPWETGKVAYEGVLIGDLLDAVAATGTSIRVTALNDFYADIEIADIRSIGVLLAYKRNGEYMSVRDKGPLFVIFPFSTKPSLATEDRYSQSVWQVNRITVK